MRNITVLLVVVAIAAMVVPAYGDATADFYLNVNNGAWVAPGSWTPTGGPPAMDKSVLIRNDGTATITTGNTAVCSSLRLGDRVGAYPYTYPGGHISQNGGSFTADSSSWIGYNSNGSYTQSGGTASFGGTSYMGRAVGAEAEDAGIYDLSGTGEVTFSTFRIGAYGGSGAFTQTGDSTVVDLSGELVVHYGGAGTGTYDLYDGHLEAGKLKIGGNGVFHIFGSAPDKIDVVSYQIAGNQPLYKQSGGSKLIVEIDAGFDATNERIYIHNTRANVSPYVAIFEAGSLLDVSLLDAGVYTPNLNDYFLLLKADNISNGGGTNLALTGDDAGDWEIVWGGDDGAGGHTTMGVKYVPEPATMCLLGIGGIGVLIRRRRK